jgi:hypothetical protein
MRHAGEKLRLVPAGHLEFRTLELQLAIQPSVENRHRTLAGESLQHVHDVGGVAARRLAPDDQYSDDSSVPQHRYGEDRPPTGGIQPFSMCVEQLTL